jgi:hypothetical protein
MMETITILFKRQPDDIRFIEGGYVKMAPMNAFKHIDSGDAVGYDPQTKEEFNPFLSKEYPNRKILFNNGIYTEKRLKPSLGYVATLDGIGSKTIDTYKELLGLMEPKETDG